MSENGKGTAWNPDTYETKKKETLGSGRTVTHEAETKSRQGYGLDKSVDPKTHGTTRESVDVLKKQPNGKYLLTHGIALPFKEAGDLTGSMGGNIDEFFKLLPRSQKLLVGSEGLLGRYDVHFATAGIQDKKDKHPYMLSEFERDNLIEAQMSKIVPERNGFDTTEDYQLDLFYTGERVKSTIWRHGLKGYSLITGDEIGRDYLDPVLVKDVFDLDIQKISTKDLAKKVLEKWHVFYLQVGSISWTTKWWEDLLGEGRVIYLPSISMMAEVKACIVGLTEGIFELKDLEEFLINKAKVPKYVAKEIVNAVLKIPTRAQADLPNFDKIPLAGTEVDDPEDLYPDSAVKTKTSSGENEEIDLNL